MPRHSPGSPHQRVSTTIPPNVRTAATAPTRTRLHGYKAASMMLESVRMKAVCTAVSTMSRSTVGPAHWPGPTQRATKEWFHNRIVAPTAVTNSQVSPRISRRTSAAQANCRRPMRPPSPEPGDVGARDAPVAQAGDGGDRELRPTDPGESQPGVRRRRGQDTTHDAQPRLQLHALVAEVHAEQHRFRHGEQAAEQHGPE